MRRTDAWRPIPALGLMSHRGPDDAGWYEDRAAGVWLGMRRLSIIDVEGGRQPISNEDGSVWIVFNGEIYNYRDLRRRLEGQGHRFATASDTEAIVHLYEEYGSACVHLLRGMFAFAVWDQRRRHLFVARDRMGIKPLYYTRTTAGNLYFASEIKALLEAPDVPREMDLEALDLYLALQYVPGPRTLFKDIWKLPAGHTLTADAAAGTEPEIVPYWSPVLGEGQERMDPRDAAVEFGQLLDESVRLRLIADVPLGALLSGGIDSATVVGLMARHSSRPVKTFTVGFEEHGFSEVKHARTVARHFGTDHHEIVVTGDMADLLPRLVWQMDEPIADRAALPMYLVSRLARSQVKVVLTGEGGDELLGGYPRYAWFSLASRIEQSVPLALRRGAAGLSTLLPSARLRRQAELLVDPLSPVQRHLRWVGNFDVAARHRLYRRPDLRDLLGRRLPESVVGSFLDATGGSSGRGDGRSIEALMALDLRTWLVDDILMKVDKMSMATSVEARVPLLDHRLVEFTAALPLSVKVQNLGTKRLLRQVATTLLPRSIVTRKKHPFDVPVAHWLRGPLYGMLADNLLSDRFARRALFDTGEVGRLVEEHVSGRADHNQQLWNLLCLELWQRTFIDRELTFESQLPAGHSEAAGPVTGVGAVTG